jgi:hypothetical protein
MKKAMLKNTPERLHNANTKKPNAKVQIVKITHLKANHTMSRTFSITNHADSSDKSPSATNLYLNITDVVQNARKVVLQTAQCYNYTDGGRMTYGNN